MRAGGLSPTGIKTQPAIIEGVEAEVMCRQTTGGNSIVDGAFGHSVE